MVVVQFSLMMVFAPVCLPTHPSSWLVFPNQTPQMDDEPSDLAGASNDTFSSRAWV